MAGPEAKHFHFNWAPFNFRAVVSFQAVLEDRLAESRPLAPVRSS